MIISGNKESKKNWSNIETNRLTNKKICKTFFHSETEAKNIPTKYWNLFTKLHGATSITAMRT
jgi:hypothetical protein